MLNLIYLIYCLLKRNIENLDGRSQRVNKKLYTGIYYQNIHILNLQGLSFITTYYTTSDLSDLTYQNIYSHIFLKNEFCHHSIVPFLITMFIWQINLVALFIDNLSLVRSPSLLWRRVDAREEKDVGKGARRPEIPGDEADDANEHSEPNGTSVVGWILEDLAHCLWRGQCCPVSSQAVQHFCASTIYS